MKKMKTKIDFETIEKNINNMINFYKNKELLGRLEVIEIGMPSFWFDLVKLQYEHNLGKNKIPVVYEYNRVRLVRTRFDFLITVRIK